MKIKNNKFFRIGLLTVMSVFTINTVSFAGFQYLWKVSDATYVSTYHPDNYFADTYDGTASVRGTDRGYSRKGNKGYYKWTRITYDVQGTKSSVTAYSGGKNNSSVVVKKITVKDKWNFGPKTKAYYNYYLEEIGYNPGPKPIPSRVKKNINK